MVMLKLEDQPPLIQAIFSGEIDDVRNLLDTKLDVNYQDAEKRSPLHAAAFKGDKELAELLLAQGARVNTKDCKWLTPLHRACGVGSEDTVALLLSHNADTTARDRQWQTPLHIAAANNAVECVSHLLHYVPNVNVTDRSGRTALHHAALNGHNDVVELLISKGCIVNACDKKDCRPIHWAAHLGHVDTMELLMRNGADIHVKDRNQYTPLHVAAASGMLYACRLLLHAGADVDAQNSFGNTPLHIACLNGHLPVCQELAMYNANLEAVNSRGQTPLHIAAASTQGVACLTYLLDQNVNINKQSLDGRTALHMSAIHGRFTRSKTLIDKGAIVDSQDKNGNTALHIAAQYGHDILTSTLLDYGADPNKRGYEGRTPLHSCCLSGFVEVSRKFIQIKVDLNTTDDTGKTAVHCAAYKGSVECLDLLVSQGANFKLQDIYGRTPLHYSATQGHYTCVFTLVGIGAPVNIIDNEGCTPLHLAAAYDLEGRCVEYLLQHKADPKMKDGRGYTPVHYAVNGSNFNSLSHLLEAAGKNYNFQEEGMPLNTPLHLAARRGDIKILNSVISYFPDVNIKNETGCTPLLIAAREGHTHSVQMLLRYGAKVGICEDVHNMSPVHYSAKNGHMHCLALLVDNTEDKNIIDKPDKFNRTALMLAISGSHIKCVLTLLKSEANPNIVDSDRHSSLFRAVVTNQNNVVQYLISKGAYVTEPDINGKTVLHLASACGHFVCLQTIMLHIPIEKAASLDNHDFSALHWGCYHGFHTCVEYLLQKGVFKKIEGNPFSPVHCATFVGSERCLELLYNAFGAEIVKLTDTRKRTPLHIAALHGHTDCARYLLEQGAEIESKDEFGRTALIAASQNGQSQMLELLIAYKANLKSCDNNGNTALHMACLKKHSHTALLLLEYINDVDTINTVNNDKKTPLHLSARNGLVEVTRNLIKKGSSVLSVDSNGLTPALCCAPNPSVAQCLAIILANHPVQFPVVNHSTKAETQQLFQKLVANLTLPNVTLRTSLIQTDMSLQRDPCELFDAIVHKMKPDYSKKTLKTHRKKAHVVYSSPNLHKTHKRKPEIVLIENYGKNDGFDDSFKEVKGLGLHRSFSEIALVPTSDSLDRESVRNSTLDFHKINKDFDLILTDSNKNCKRMRNNEKFNLNSLKGGIENALCSGQPHKNSILKQASIVSNKGKLISANKCIEELTEVDLNVQKDSTANNSFLQKEIANYRDEPSTSSQFLSCDDAFKPKPKKFKINPSENDKTTEKIQYHENLNLLQYDKVEQLCCSINSTTRVRKKLCTCQYVCEKCVLKNSFDEFEINNTNKLKNLVDENEEDKSYKDDNYQIHSLATIKLGIDDDELEKDPEKQLTPAELAAFLRDELENSTSFEDHKKSNQPHNSPNKISTACVSSSDIWPKVTLDSDRIIMPSDLDKTSTALVQNVESKINNFSSRVPVQLVSTNRKKMLSQSNRISKGRLKDIKESQRTCMKQSCGSIPNLIKDQILCTNQRSRNKIQVDVINEDSGNQKDHCNILLMPYENNVDHLSLDNENGECRKNLILEDNNQLCMGSNKQNAFYIQNTDKELCHKNQSIEKQFHLKNSNLNNEYLLRNKEFLELTENAKGKHNSLFFREISNNEMNTNFIYNNQNPIVLHTTENISQNDLITKSSTSLEIIFENKTKPIISDSGSNSSLSCDPLIIPSPLILQDGEKTSIRSNEVINKIDTSSTLKNNKKFELNEMDEVKHPMLKSCEHTTLSKPSMPSINGNTFVSFQSKDNASIKNNTEQVSSDVMSKSIQFPTKNVTTVHKPEKLNAFDIKTTQLITNHNEETKSLQPDFLSTTQEIINSDRDGIIKNSAYDDINNNLKSPQNLNLVIPLENNLPLSERVENEDTKDNKITILHNISKTMEVYRKESSSILDTIIKTMEQSIEETNTACIMDSIDGIKQLMMDSNVVLKNVGDTIKGGRYKESIKNLNKDEIFTAQFKDDKNLCSIKQETPSCVQKSGAIVIDNALQVITSSDKFQNNLSTKIFEISTNLENPSSSLIPTELMLPTNIKPDLFKICTKLNEECMKQIPLIEMNDESTNNKVKSTNLEKNITSSNDIKSFSNLAHTDIRRPDNLESIIIDNAVVSSSIDLTNVMSRCCVDSEHFDIVGSHESNNRINHQCCKDRESPNNKHKSFVEEKSVSGSFTFPLAQDISLLQDKCNVFEDGIESEEFEGRRSQMPEVGDGLESLRRNRKQEERMSRKSVSKGIKMRMKKSEEVQSSNSHESFLHRNSHYGVFAAHGSDFTREDDAHSQNSSDNEYY